ncbi:MAG: Gfo/Idh/MocA family oxidoreductase [Terracidiphilus sp.]|jgi:predicted dehydrogenase
MTKIGLVGLGYWGPNLARVLNQSRVCDFVACCDLDAKKMEQTVRQYPTVQPMGNLDALLDSDVDAVVIATPISTHYELARKALEAGKHVMVEKPLAHESALARDLVLLAEQKERELFTGHTFIYSPPVQKVKQLIDAGELGDLHYISLSRVNLGLYQKDVDVVWDLAVHDISILLYWLGESPIRGASFGRACVQRNKRDVAFLWLEFPSGVIVSNEVSWLSPQKMRRTCIVGSQKMVVYDDTSPDEKIRIYDKGVDWHQPQTFGEFQLSYRTGDMVAPYLDNSEPLLREVECFVRCIEKGEKGMTSGDFGAKVVEALELLQASPLDVSEVTVATGEVTPR